MPSYSKHFWALFTICSIVYATNLDCDAVSYSYLFCDYLLPKTASGSPDYNLPDGNSSKPWVIGGNTVVNLTAGNYDIGMIDKFGSPISAIFIIENGTLAIEDQGLNEVSFGADIYICDNANFRIKDSNFRLNSGYQYQYMIWSSGTSKTVFQGLNFTTIAAAAQASNPNLSGSLGAHYILANASLTAIPGKSGYSVTTYRYTLDSWELLDLDSATINIDRMHVFSEFYIASRANFTVTNSRDFDFFFEACPGFKFELDNLPELCSLNASDNTFPQCVTPEVAPINYTMGYPLSDFTINFKNVSMFSWAVSIFKGSNVTVKNVGKYANLNFGLNIAPVCADINCNNITINSYTVRLGPDYFEGFEDLFTLTRINTVTQGFQVWFQENNLNLTILNGSTVGDISPSPGSTVQVYGTQQTFGTVYAQGGSVIYFYDCNVGGSVSIFPGSNVNAERTTFTSVVNILGNLYLADSTYNSDLLSIQDGSQFFTVSLATPTNNSVYSINDTLTVIGTATAVTSNSQSISPFPVAYLSASSMGYTIAMGNVSSTLVNGTIGVYELESVPPGTWVVQLDFGPNTAASIRTVQVVGTGSTTDSSTTGGTGSPTGTTDSSTTGVSTESSTGYMTTGSTTSNTRRICANFLFILFLCVVNF